MNYTFDLCVKILLELADLFGTTYKAINVWIFVIIWPIFTLLLIGTVMLLIGTVIFQRRKIRQLKSKVSEKGAT